MKKIIFILLLIQLSFSQDSDSFDDYPMEEIQSPIVYEPEKKPNWNSDLERFEYISVVSEGLSNLKKDELYYRLVRWATLAFPSVKNVVELQDKASGNIIIKAYLSNQNISKTEYDIGRRKKESYDQLTKFRFPFILDIKMKDGKYKYELFISKFIIQVDLYGSMLSSPASSGVGEPTPITNMQHNYVYSTKYSGFQPKNMYELVDEKAKELLLNMNIFVLSESFEEDW